VVPGEAPPDADPFVRKVLQDRARESAFVGRPLPLAFGGGTPSRLPPDDLGRLVAALGPTGETSLEANPEDVTPDWLDGVLAAGVDRISLGVQSLRSHVARRLGRAHTVTQARAAMALLARSAARTWSVDLIFAVPGQTVADLGHDLDDVLDAGAPHVSVYGLTIEDGTRFATATARGRMPSVDDASWREMYDLLVGRLRAAGLERYEVSNFARPGHRSVHNGLYWSDRPYLGLGPSAHSYAPDGERWVEAADLAAWLGGDAPARERPSPVVAATDLRVSGLRSVDGLALAALETRTGCTIDPEVVARLVGGGLLRPDPGHLALTDAGFPLCDGIVARLAASLTAPRMAGPPGTP
jgi:oxygen-independent coproporphyrinogen-3 oxidase